jgi:hypothetical protein
MHSCPTFIPGHSVIGRLAALGSPIEPHVDAGRLDKGRVERIEAEGPGFDLGAQIAVGQQHGDHPIRAAAGTRPGRPTGGASLGIVAPTMRV